MAEEMGRRRPASQWHMPSWNRARKLVHRYAVEVNDVAERLLQVGRLSGDEIDEILQEVHPCRRMWNLRAKNSTRAPGDGRAALAENQRCTSHPTCAG